jgi:hypothetical protein
MSLEDFERGYLLPRGCKDLIDVIGLQGTPRTEISLKALPPNLCDLSKLLLVNPQKKIFLKSVSTPPIQPPAMKGEILVSDRTTVRELAALLGEKPFKIIADAMELGIFANVNQSLGFEVVSQIAAKYGYTAKRNS